MKMMSSKSSTDKEVHLQIWSEVVGTYKGLFVTDYDLQVRISNEVLSFPKDSDEALYVQENLGGVIGRKIGILKTDVPEKPLCIRLVD